MSDQEFDAKIMADAIAAHGLLQGREITERQRMLTRVLRLLMNEAKPAAPFVVEDLSTGLLTLRSSLKRIGQVGRAAVHERELALLEARQPAEWALEREERAEPGVLEPNEPMAVGTSRTAVRCAELAKAKVTT